MRQSLGLCGLLLIVPFVAPACAQAERKGCASEVSSRAQLIAAAGRSANEGGVVCVLPGTYVDPDFRDFSHEKPVTLRSKLPRRAVLSGGVGLHNVRGVRLEGFRVTGTIANDQEPMKDVAFVRNDIGGSAATAFQFGCGMENVVVARNRIHDIASNGEWGSGYGMYVWGDCPKPGLRVSYNTFERIQADGMELGAITRFRIVGNDIRQIKWHGPADMDPHADALMIWADSSHGLVKDNRVTDGNGLLFSGLTDVRIENNLIAHIDNWCFQSGDAVRNTYVNNTVYDCGYDYNGGGLGGGSGSTLDGERANGNILRRNLITSLAASDHAVAGWDHNLILHGDRGPGDVPLLPRFRDRIDWEPTNTPFQVGYRVAPAGAVSVCARYSGASRSACKLNRDVARRCGGIRAPRRSSRCQRRVRAQARRRTIRASTRRAGQHTAACQRTAPRGTSPQPADR